MNTRLTKNLLWLSGISFLILSAAVAYNGLQQPVIMQDESKTIIQTQNNVISSSDRSATVVTLADYEKAWRRPLRTKTQAPTPVKAQPQAAPPPPPPPPNVKLLGTVVEDGNSYAIIEAKRGEQAIYGVGEIISQQMQVVAINPGKVELMYRGQTVTLESESEQNGK